MRKNQTDRPGAIIRWWLAAFAAAGLMMLATVAVEAQDTGAGTGAAAESQAPPDGKKSALDIYQEGGWFMHVLLLCSIGMIAVIVYCFIQITPKKMSPRNLVDRVNASMATKDVGTAYQMCQANPSSYSNVLSTALLKVNFDRDLANKASMVDAAIESLDEEEHKQMVWINYLNVFATLAPMIGLLGTVWGMIEAFDKLAASQNDPQQLAGGIKKAMGTTAGGLLVGIPAMFFYFFFRDKLQGVMTTIQKNASFAIDILSGEIRLEGATETAAEETGESSPES